MAGTATGRQSDNLPGQEALARVPRATYRLQLRADFGLNDIRELLPYLRDLGVSDVYLSPLFRAREESSHGYDVVDHGSIDPAFGTLADFKSLAESVRDAGMGILLDVVPNHMGINDPANKWWLDVLENGEAAEHAEYFDIDWQPAASNLKHKVLLPFLGAPFGETLESGQLHLVFDQQRLQVAYGQRRFPLAPATWPALLDEATSRLTEEGEATGDRLHAAEELRAVASELGEDQQGARRRLAQLLEVSPAAREAIDAVLAEFNGRVGERRSFDALEKLLDQQWYRLAYWRVAADEINYRRFFDINDLAAIRVEDPRVFEAVHRLVARFLAEGWVAGLRIDHPDGLLDPESYFQNLQALASRSRGEPASAGGEHLYILAEKILTGDESLPVDWLVSGTTGYDFMNFVNRLLVQSEGLATLRQDYEGLTDQPSSALDVVYRSKRTVLFHSLASELHVLAAQLYRLAQRHRASRDFTLPSLQAALREVIACLSVYRTYVRPRGWEVSDADYRQATAAVRLAKRRNPATSVAVFDFITSVLLLQHPPALDPELAAERRRFVLKFQQVTGPAMAKGLEDTAFYRFYPLASLNEVGGELDARPLDVDEFHRLMARRLAEWPHSMSATGTHDTKRGEDVRARLHVLSEIPDQWEEAVLHWQEQNRPLLHEVEGDYAPNASEQYLLYQTLVGTWPAVRGGAAVREAYCRRMVDYMRKALREAKLHTSWTSPSTAYEEAVDEFVRHLVTGAAGKTFRKELGQLVERIAAAGAVNGLAQLLLKIAMPGVPDFYQGTEFWDFNLVDPDNRRPVDFDRRRTALATLRRRYRESPARLAAELAADWTAPETKMFVAWRGLEVRRELADVCQRGDYVPLAAAGVRAPSVFAAARRLDNRWLAIVVPRHIQCIRCSGEATQPLGALGQIDWQDATITLADCAGGWRNQLTGEPLTSRAADSGMCEFRVADLLTPLPVALLTSPAA
jgi:(1->4)-alpha-D-glucan 1-alpha-D-glucosylmutase